MKYQFKNIMAKSASNVVLHHQAIVKLSNSKKNGI